MSYLANVFSKTKTAQTQPIPGANQVKNSAGGFGYAVSDWTMLRRFLVLGAEGGSYYASEQTLSRKNALAVSRCIKADGERVVREIVSVSQAGAAPKNDPAIFALALAAAQGDEKTKTAAYAALPLVCRTGTHLFHFAAFSDGMRGWGRGLRNAVGRWYTEKPVRDLAYQVVKYGQRDGWTHRDMLRLAHVRPGETNAGQKILTHYMAHGWPDVGDAPHPNADLVLVWAAEKAKRAQSAREIVDLVTKHDLPREAIPTVWLQNAAVWEALLPKMPLTALVRNLATLTRLGVLDDKRTARRVGETLTDAKRLRGARAHPLALLSALKTYEQGHGERGKHTWKPIASLVNALDAAFYASFGNVQGTGKRWLLGLDVSGSMGMGLIAGVPGVSPRVASAALALLTASTEEHQFVAFCDTLRPLTISPAQRMDDVLRTISNLPFGGTDCALPMIWAQKNKVKVDVFAVYTDSETWFGGVHPIQALNSYRQATGIAAKLIVVGMVANKFTIADPSDAGMLDVVGFDLAAPGVMSDFARQ